MVAQEVREDLLEARDGATSRKEAFYGTHDDREDQDADELYDNDRVNDVFEIEPDAVGDEEDNEEDEEGSDDTQ